MQALGTAWGLLRHYWVVFKLLLTVVATVVLLSKLGPPISYLATAAEELSRADVGSLRTSLTLHAAGGLVLLLATTTLAIFKPRGVMRYGARERSEPGSTLPTPRWVKVFGAITILLAVVVGVMTIAGGHGPGAHRPSGV